MLAIIFHKVSTRLVCENQVVCLEDLYVKNMVKITVLPNPLQIFLVQVRLHATEYKAKRYGTHHLESGQVLPLQSALF
jgi:putative transposase